MKIKTTAPKAISTIVRMFGSAGHARIDRLVVVRRDFRPGGALVLVGLDVKPLDPSQKAFHDEEALLVKTESLEKLVVGNVIRVRFDHGRDRRVFPFSPIEVVGKEP